MSTRTPVPERSKHGVFLNTNADKSKYMARVIQPIGGPSHNYRPRFDKAKDRREKAQILANFGTKYSLPVDAYISDVNNNLAKIMVPFESTDIKAPTWRGAIIDYSKGFLVKPGLRIPVIRVEDGAEELEDFLSIMRTSLSDKFGYIPFLGGALVSVFKYEGQVYYSTGRNLGVSKSMHPGAVDAGNVLVKLLGETFNTLFEEDVPTYQVSYDFAVFTPGTLDVTRADVALPSAILVGVSNLTSDVQGSLRTSNIPLTHVLNENDYYPTTSGMYYRTQTLTEENAEKWLSGEITGYPEELLITRTDANGDTYNYRLQPDSAYYRHLLRGDVANVTVRMAQLLSEYELVCDNETRSCILMSVDNRKDDIPLELPFDSSKSDIQIIASELKNALPLSREQEVNKAVNNINSLHRRLFEYFSSNSYNEHHPASEYYNTYHAYDKKTLNLKIWNLPEKTLFDSLRWYKLV